MQLIFLRIFPLEMSKTDLPRPISSTILFFCKKMSTPKKAPSTPLKLQPVLFNIYIYIYIGIYPIAPIFQIFLMFLKDAKIALNRVFIIYFDILVVFISSALKWCRMMWVTPQSDWKKVHFMKEHVVFQHVRS